MRLSPCQNSLIFCAEIDKDNNTKNRRVVGKTGVYSFPVKLAAKIAVQTVNRFLQNNPDSFDLVEWVLFDSNTESVYKAEVDIL